jgi:hypothetical protein
MCLSLYSLQELKSKSMIQCGCRYLCNRAGTSCGLMFGPYATMKMPCFLPTRATSETWALKYLFVCFIMSVSSYYFCLCVLFSHFLELRFSYETINKFRFPSFKFQIFARSRKFLTYILCLLSFQTIPGSFGIPRNHQGMPCDNLPQPKARLLLFSCVSVYMYSSLKLFLFPL